MEERNPIGKKRKKNREEKEESNKPKGISLWLVACIVVKDNHRQSQWRKRLRVRTKKELPDRLKLRSANQTKNIEEFFSMTEKDINSLEDTKWRCEYHIVFAPKYRRQVIYREIKADIGEILRRLCQQKGIEIIEANACPDHIHMLISIPPKYSVAQIMGYLKGKSSLMIFDRHANLKYKYGNRHFWARGYYADTVGRNKKQIEEYIKHQLEEDQIADQMSLKEYIDPFTGSKESKA